MVDLMRNLEIVIANPSGNKTAFVLTPVDTKDYKLIGKEILRFRELGIEQVGFIKNFGSNPHMDMCGMEFCGNAGRAFGLLCALMEEKQGHTYVEISESGCESKLAVEVDTISMTAYISMPLPQRILVLADTGICELDGATLVDLGGIMHIVFSDTNINPSLELFHRIKNYIMKEFNPPAMGVMFIKQDFSIVPIVYVKDVDSVYEEGSCGSGTTACAIAWSQDCKDGHRDFLVKQPAGEIEASVDIKAGKIINITIGGYVEISNPQNFMIEI